jgi:hypothetical protein
MLERTDAITNEVLESFTFVLEYPTVCSVHFQYTHHYTVRNKKTVNAEPGIADDVLLCACANWPTFLSVG